MNFSTRTTIFGIFSSVFQSHHIPVRYRYYAEKIARGPIVKKFGYKDKVARSGILPRLKDANPLPIPEYAPGNAWSPEKAMFGQNDYIDILGGGKLKPFDVCYNVPKWLRGRKGNEMQLLTLKRRIFANTKFQYECPTKWENLNKRIRYLYKYLNRKTKTNFMKR